MRFLRLVDSLLTSEECQHFITLLDTSELSLVERGDMATYERNVWINEAFADEMYKRVKDYLPPGTVRCNEYFRFSKYSPGQEFKLHTDGTNWDKYGNVSKYTINIFLNSSFEGGETDFFEGPTRIRAVPQSGRGALFDREILHCGNQVLKGTKYLLRTDAMVLPDPPGVPMKIDDKVLRVSNGGYDV